MKNIIIPVGIILLAVSAAAVMFLMKKEPDKNEPEVAALLVETVALRKEDVTLSVKSQGNLTPRTETSLVSEISAVVLEVSPKFVAGGFIEKGEVLLKLNPVDYEVELQRARASLLSMRAKLTQETARSEQAAQEWELSGRKKSVAPILALRTPYLEEAKANVLFAEANMKMAQRRLEQTLIRSPYRGMVKDKLVDVGQYVTTGTAVANTFAVDFAELRLPLTDQDVAYLDLPGFRDVDDENEKSGPDVKLSSVIGGVSYHWNATIVRTEGVIDERTRVQFAVARIIDPYGMTRNDDRPPLSIGSFVQARIVGRVLKNVIAIPRLSVRGTNQVLIMDSEFKLRKRTVSPLFSDEKYIYINEGVTEDEQAIVSAIEEPVDGVKLRSTEDL